VKAQRLAGYAPLFAALGDATRLRLVARLCDKGPQSIARLAAGEEITRQAVTKHLQALEDAGLVASSRAGRERMWEIRAARLAHAQRALAEISAQWDGAISRLRAFVER
jgi:DNA-binding transcriptional ArsR family regulator